MLDVKEKRSLLPTFHQTYVFYEEWDLGEGNSGRERGRIVNDLSAMWCLSPHSAAAASSWLLFAPKTPKFDAFFFTKEFEIYGAAVSPHDRKFRDGDVRFTSFLNFCHD